MRLMKRAITAACLAASFAVALAAQSTSTASSAQNPPDNAQRGPRPVTAIGCLRAGDTAGTFMLTDVQLQGARKPDDTTAGTTGSTAGSTAGTTGPSEQTRRMPTTVMLSPAADVDLKPHVGHKIEVTGTMNAGRANRDTTASTTAGGTTTGTGTSGTSGTAGTTATAGAAEQGTRAAMRNVTVTSVRMISESCS